MQVISFAWGIVAILGFIVGLFPCLGAFNWVNIPFAFIGLIVSYITRKNAKPGEPNRPATFGMYLCLVAVFLGAIRLILGFGIL
ncbi:MAG: hypothetical protein HF314_17425 [Ignavibacteria bacterium]|nr:hypothetical protein [Ignavibacteria bacterium]MCU7504868.1 hypothetical protein [Ignavibacteria bacterium]MCU7518320.1 hypothetical protein [Ignavibacteria bacterium]